jgi:hypothetical protein
MGYIGMGFDEMAEAEVNQTEEEAGEDYERLLRRMSKRAMGLSSRESKK